MKSAWREIVSSAVFACFGMSSVATMIGCQSWSPSKWGVPVGSRVPPPATGSYQHQGAYYNNPSTGTPAAPVKATTQSMPVTPAPVVNANATYPLNDNGSLPVTNLSPGASSLNSQSANGQVKTAGYNASSNGLAEVVTASSLQASPINADGLPNGGAELSATAGEGASLQWR